MTPPVSQNLEGASRTDFVQDRPSLPYLPVGELRHLEGCRIRGFSPSSLLEV